MNLLRREPFIALCLACLCIPSVASATFHLMQIEQVIGGIDGTAAQAIQLRMRSGGQGAVHQGKLIAYDAAGNNPVTLIDFATDVSNETQGSRILIATTAFITKTEPNAVPDYTMAAIPAGYLAGGSLTFERDSGGILWRVSWGSYSGPTTGETTNDSNGNFGKFGSALPSGSSNVTALLFNGAANAESTDNAADYSLTSGPAVFTNNKGCTFTADDNPNCGATDTDGDGTNDNCDACTDSDGDGAGDPGFDDNCLATCPVDGCPNDAGKTAPGACGCGVADTDSDGDGVPNCHDTCANTPSGESVNAEGCSCSQLPSGDSDGDGISNCDDQCPNNPDPNAPGPCGCDTDPTDTDGDGTPDCADGCPNDPGKIAPGNLGCGVSETDTDGDLVPDASDNCPSNANADQADTDGDGIGDACDSDNGGGGDNGGGCGGTGGCAPISGGLLPLLLLGNRMLRRRVNRRG